VQTRDYRPDIDGLRTIAVMSVLLYHFGVSGFTGGFVGVDIFFVISGFLITRILVTEIEETGRLSFARFYTRRARRLFPAVLATVVVSFGLAFALFSAEQMERFAGSAIFTVVSLSNVFFWLGSDYFDAENVTKPLLHTWSLSVEEQFYFIWPALMLLIVTKARRAALWIIVAIAIVSLAFCEYLLTVDRAAAFFLLPGRIVELAIGAAMVWLIKLRPRNERWLEPLLLAAFALMLAPVVQYTHDTPFPGWTALIPCLGAALAIYAGQARFAGILLRNPVSVAIGKWSYSIYLVHWPLFVFFTAFTYRTPDILEQAGLLVVSIMLGWAQYRFVEERFRHERASGAWSRPAYGLGCALLAIATLVPASMVWAGGGAQWRIPESRLVKTNRQWRAEETRLYCRKRDPEAPRDIFTCQNYRGKDRNIVIWGDSHALHLVAGVSERFKDYNVYVAYMSGCTPQSGFLGVVRNMNSKEDTKACIDRNHRTLELLESGAYDAVIVTSAKRDTPDTSAKPINFIMDRLAAVDGLASIYLADFIRPGVELIDCVQVPSYALSDEMLAARCQGDEATATRELDYNAALGALVSRFVDIQDVQCPAGRCQFVEGSTPLFRDTHHLSTFGSIKFIQDLRLPID
jgi:peptidoglycan/LPS O-acetylase OafA/YrhL